jgi:hypothetical protein
VGEAAYLPDQGDYHWEGGIGIGLERDIQDGQSVDDSVDSGEGIVRWSNIRYLR